MNAISSISSGLSLIRLVSEFDAARARLEQACLTASAAGAEVEVLSGKIAALLDNDGSLSCASGNCGCTDSNRNSVRGQLRRLKVGDAALIDPQGRKTVWIAMTQLKAEGKKYRGRSQDDGTVRVERLA